MTYLFTQYWIFVALAFTFGLFVGWATCGGAPLNDWRDHWYGWGIAAFLAGCFVAAFKGLPGLSGHLLEVALLLFGAYVLGCIAGCNGRWGFGTAPETTDESRPPKSRTPVAAPTPVIPALGPDRSIFGIDTSAIYPGARPAALAAPRGRKADDLTAIAGVDSPTAKALGDIGVHHHDQIAAWGDAEAQWVEHHLAHSGRVARENWIGQARDLAGVAAGTDDPLARAVSEGARTLAALQSRRARAAAIPDDDLTLIKGVGPKTAAALNALGVRRLAQIADWTADAVGQFDDLLESPGRTEREHWVEQARLLAGGFDTPHAAAVKSGALAIDHKADAPLDEAAAQALRASLPQQAARVADEWSYGGSRPLGFAAAPGGRADDLKQIKGISRQTADRLNALGIWRFDQIAAWTRANAQWVGAYLAVPGRIDREHWVEQAELLALGATPEVVRQVIAGADSIPRL